MDRIELKYSMKGCHSEKLVKGKMKRIENFGKGRGGRRVPNLAAEAFFISPHLLAARSPVFGCLCYGKAITNRLERNCSVKGREW